MRYLVKILDIMGEMNNFSCDEKLKNLLTQKKVDAPTNINDIMRNV